MAPHTGRQSPTGTATFHARAALRPLAGPALLGTLAVAVTFAVAALGRLPLPLWLIPAAGGLGALGALLLQPSLTRELLRQGHVLPSADPSTDRGDPADHAALIGAPPPRPGRVTTRDAPAARPAVERKTAAAAAPPLLARAADGGRTR